MGGSGTRRFPRGGRSKRLMWWCWRKSGFRSRRRRCAIRSRDRQGSGADAGTRAGIDDGLIVAAARCAQRRCVDVEVASGGVRLRLEARALSSGGWTIHSGRTRFGKEGKSDGAGKGQGTIDAGVRLAAGSWFGACLRRRRAGREGQEAAGSVVAAGPLPGGGGSPRFASRMPHRRGRCSLRPACWPMRYATCARAGWTIW
jgi:hypothetical protein